MAKLITHAFKNDRGVDANLQDVIFFEDPNARIKQMISSILAGYAWDEANPYVKESQRRLTRLAEFVRQENATIK